MGQTPRAPRNVSHNNCSKKPLNWPEYEVIEIDNKLAAKASRPGNAREAIKTAMEKADTALDQLSVEFPTWMKDESDRLKAIRDEIAQKGASKERIDRLFTCSHDIKGQASTLGYPMAGAIGKLLCALITESPDPALIPLNVLDQHVNAIRAIVRQNVQGKGTAQAQHIIKALNILDHQTLQKLAREMRRADQPQSTAPVKKAS